MQPKPTIGVIGQGWVGKNYADHFEDRGFTVVRYAKEAPYTENGPKIKGCDFVLVAVPTPTTPSGFDVRAVRQVLAFVGRGKVAVLKSTVLPGTARALQEENPDIVILSNPEFLREKSARRDVDEPARNIIGVVEDEDRNAANRLLKILPSAPYTIVCSAEEAELTKYAGNTFLYMKVVYGNILHDLAEELGCDPDMVTKNMAADSRIGPSHLNPFYGDGTRRRGAGGNCFIKDFKAFVDFYHKTMDDSRTIKLLEALEQKNNQLLRESGKDLDILKNVYGK